MRHVSYPTAGRPPADKAILDELVMLLQAAIDLANTERWALERGELKAPTEVAHNLRQDAYEVTVVDQFNRIARRFFERQGYRSVWERPFRTGKRGAPKSVDVAAFNEAKQSELRIELGRYSKGKLREDAVKLALLIPDALPAYSDVMNIILLWEIIRTKATKKAVVSSMSRFEADALRASGDKCTVAAVLASSTELFVAEPRRQRHVTVGVFEVT
jgi:hypothetical protein